MKWLCNSCSGNGYWVETNIHRTNMTIEYIKNKIGGNKLQSYAHNETVLDMQSNPLQTADLMLLKPLMMTYDVLRNPEHCWHWCNPNAQDVHSRQLQLYVIYYHIIHLYYINYYMQYPVYHGLSCNYRFVTGLEHISVSWVRSNPPLGPHNRSPPGRSYSSRTGDGWGMIAGLQWTPWVPSLTMPGWLWVAPWQGDCHE